MTATDWLRWLHLLAAATWMGGLITMAALVVALRKAGVDQAQLRAAARQFGRLSWTAMGIAIITGVWQVERMSLSWSYGRLHLKLGLVALVVIVTAGHQLTARRSSPAVRGIVQLVMLVSSLAIFAAAVSL